VRTVGGAVSGTHEGGNMKTWVKAGMGCVLLWTSACAVVPGSATTFRQEAVRPGAQEESLSTESGTQANPKRCDPAEIQRLESEALALAVAGGCEDVSQCRAAPVGVQACGGPRGYVVYCAATTDEKALLKALARLARREERFNRQCDIVSICIFIAEPELELVNGECRAVVPAPEPVP
jgi:hypothetical protein